MNFNGHERELGERRGRREGERNRNRPFLPHRSMCISRALYFLVLPAPSSIASNSLYLALSVYVCALVLDWLTAAAILVVACFCADSLSLSQSLFPSLVRFLPFPLRLANVLSLSFPLPAQIMVCQLTRKGKNEERNNPGSFCLSLSRDSNSHSMSSHMVRGERSCRCREGMGGVKDIFLSFSLLAAQDIGETHSPVNAIMILMTLPTVVSFLDMSSIASIENERNACACLPVPFLFDY